MRKIIHLSDLHVGYGDLGERCRVIVDNLIFSKQPAGDYVVLITGDLSENGFHAAWHAEAAALIGKLTDAGYGVLVAPGNHDYGTGNLGSAELVGRFKQTFFGGANVEYPKLDVIDDVAFIGLDSMAEELHWYDRLFAEGELGAAQLARLDALLARPDVRGLAKRVVYLHHHPFDPAPNHELKDSAPLGKVLVRHANIDALLYGHNHAGKKRNGHWGIPRCYDAGTSTRKDGKPGYHRVIDLMRDPRLDYDGDFHGNW